MPLVCPSVHSRHGSVQCAAAGRKRGKCLRRGCRSAFPFSFAFIMFLSPRLLWLHTVFYMTRLQETDQVQVYANGQGWEK